LRHVSRIEKIICHIICTRYFYMKYVYLLQNCIVTTSKFDHLHAEWPTGTHDVMEKKRTQGRNKRGEGENLGIPAIATRIIILSFHETSCLIFVTPDSVSPSDHCKFSCNRDCESLGSCDVYDLTAFHLSCSFQFITECFNSCYKTLCLKLY